MASRVPTWTTDSRPLRSSTKSEAEPEVGGFLGVERCNLRVAIEEFEAIADAMGGGDRVEFSVSRRGSKPETVAVQFGEPEPVDEEEESAKFNVAPAKKSGSVTKRSFTDRYEPPVGSGLKSVYEDSAKPSSVLKPSPAPTPAGIRPLELDLPALDGGK